MSEGMAYVQKGLGNWGETRQDNKMHGKSGTAGTSDSREEISVRSDAHPPEIPPPPPFLLSLAIEAGLLLCAAVALFVWPVMLVLLDKDPVSTAILVLSSFVGAVLAIWFYLVKRGHWWAVQALAVAIPLVLVIMAFWCLRTAWTARLSVTQVIVSGAFAAATVWFSLALWRWGKALRVHAHRRSLGEL
jgi:hypothetical protein